ncbi:class F sortase [Phaeacidiphilus oryzae]|uniref:class F sortase n=1 Tax=Phaeacidiphilus oryzae TaxID=348818 RepID=UPI00055D6CE4|nr:class F sortase [Phaeacidiphilus oryzae]
MAARGGALAAPLLAAALLAGCAATGQAGAGSSGSASASSPVSPPSPPPASSAGQAGQAAAPLARSVPVRLRIPAIGVDAPLVQLGLAPDGTVQVPPIEANAPAGWYRGSPTPGETGPAVLLGHVTVGRYGNGVFLRLSELRQGARVLVRLRDGADASFTVYAVRTVAKNRFPTGAVYGDTDRPELRLITCGGPRTGDGYPDNVIVFASLTPGES